MCKLVKYGVIFACGIVAGVLGVAGCTYIMAKRCNLDELDINDNADIEEAMCGAKEDN